LKKNTWLSLDLRHPQENFSWYLPPPWKKPTKLEHILLNFMSAREKICGKNCLMRPFSVKKHYDREKSTNYPLLFL
jgi:hypothetical protein